MTTPAPGPAAPGAVASLALSQDTATLVPTGAVQIVATPKDAAGAPVARAVTWSSSDPSRATVSDGGVVAGVSAGIATVTAASGAQSAQVRITVKEGGIVGAAGARIVGQAGTVSVTVPAGALPPSTPITLEPATSAPASPQLVRGTAVAVGPAALNFARPVSLEVRYDPAALPSGAAENRLGAYRLDGTSWAPLADAAVDVTTKTVRVDISGGGTYAVFSQPPVARLVLSQDSMALRQGATFTFTATPMDDAGAVLAGPPATWSSSAPAVATVDEGTGLVTAVAPGTATITATAGGKSASARVVVLAPPPVPVATVTVVLNSPSLDVGQSTRAVATLRDAAGNLLDGRAVSWSSTNPLVAGVDQTGLATAAAPGQATITATSEGHSGSATLTVTRAARPVVASVVVRPDLAEISVDQTLQLETTIKDDAGNVLSDRVATWSSLNSALRVTSTGVVTGAAAGVGGVVANVEGVTASATITVRAPVPPPPSPPADTLFLTTTALTFTGDVGGSTAPGQSIPIRRVRTALLTDLSVGTITYGSGASGWLTASIDQKALALVVQPLTASLGPGTYTATVPVASSDPTIAPVSVAVTLTMRPAASPPKLVASPAIIDVSGLASGYPPPAQSVTLASADGKPVGGLSVGTIAYGAGASGWLHATLDGRSTPATLTLQAAQTGGLADQFPFTLLLSPGTYTATVPVQSSDPAAASVNVTVKFTVSAGPVIALSEKVVGFALATGGPDPDPRTITITNSGGGTLSGLRVNLQSARGITASLSSTTAPATLTIRASNAAFPEGASSPANDQFLIVESSMPGVVGRGVTIQITKQGQLVANPTTLSFSGTAGSTDPISQDVAITTLSGAVVSLLDRTDVTLSAPPPTLNSWIQAHPVPNDGTGGTKTPGALRVTVFPQFATPGTYSATIVVHATAAAATSITVNFTAVAGPAIGLLPPAIGFTSSAAGADMPPQTVSITNRTGVGSISGLSIGGITYDQWASGWLSAELSGSTVPATLTLRATRGSIAPGTYLAKVRIVSTQPVDAATVDVSLIVK